MQIIYKVFVIDQNKWLSFKDKEKALAYYNKQLLFNRSAKFFEIKKNEPTDFYEQIKMNI